MQQGIGSKADVAGNDEFERPARFANEERIPWPSLRLKVIDLDEFVKLQKAVRTMEWLGMRCVLAGLRPGIVAYLAAAGISAGSLRTSLDLELALQELNPRDEPEPQPDPEPEYEPDDAWPL